MSGAQAGRDHAVIAAPAGADLPRRLSVGGVGLGDDPVSTSAGEWFLVPASLLEAGTNALEFSGGDAVDEVLMIPLEGDHEVLHFGTFAKMAGVMSEPPVDPDQARMDVLHCDLALRIDLDSATIPEAVLGLTARSLDGSLSRCVLDLDDNAGKLTVSSVRDAATSAPLAFAHDTAAERLIIHLPAAVPEGGEFTVRVAYGGTPGVGYRRTTHNGVPLVYTYSQPYDARTWWPCKDIPADKFTIDLRLTVQDRVYGGHRVTPVSNGRLVSITANGDGTRTFHWRESHPVASYLVSICCTNYRPATGVYAALDGIATMEVLHYLYPENYAASSAEVPNTIALIGYYADLFGEYPFLGEKYSTAGWNLSSGMEHQTCTSMPDANLAVPFHRRSVHELAHMWFGDMVTYRTYDHLWLAEGWASYCEALVAGHRLGMAAYHDRMDTWTVSDDRPLISPDQDAFDTLTFRTAYYKGAWILHMLRHVIGDAAFFGATRDFLASADHRHGTAVTSEFQSFYESRTGEDLSWFFDPWTQRASRPSYRWRWSARSERGESIVDLAILQEGEIYRMPIDFEIVFADASRRVVTVTNALRFQSYAIPVGAGVPVELVFDPDNWLLDYNTEVSGTAAPAQAPVVLSVRRGAGAGEMAIAWDAIADLSATGYRLYESADGVSGWTRIRDENDLPVSVSSVALTGIGETEERYYRLAGVNAGAEGPGSDVYGARRAGTGPRCLIVDGCDRWTTESASGGRNHDFAATHGRAAAAYGSPFDSCANEAVGVSVRLADYPVVIWVLGNESTTHETFSAAEQGLVAAYLRDGGKLFVSGNEIGWDLDRAGWSSSADRAFYRDYLKASYVADDSGVYDVESAGSDSIFGDAQYAYGGGDAPYTPGYPDVIASAGSDLAMRYAGGAGAGIQYFGTFGGSATSGAVVYLGFSFETVSSETARCDLMRRVLAAFAGSSAEADGISLW